MYFSIIYSSQSRVEYYSFGNLTENRNDPFSLPFVYSWYLTAISPLESPELPRSKIKGHLQSRNDCSRKATNAWNILKYALSNNLSSLIGSTDFGASSISDRSRSPPVHVTFRLPWLSISELSKKGATLHWDGKIRPPLQMPKGEVLIVGHN